MALYADRVKDSTSITGTGAITLSGTAPTGFQSFATAFGATPQTVAYCIADQTGNNWEVGTGVFNGTTGLTRVTVLGSSNGGSLTNFSGGTQDVFCTAPAAYLLPAGANTQIQYNNAGAFGSSANFTYTTGSNTLTVGPAGATTTIETLAPTGATVAGTLRIRGKNATATNGVGGGLTLNTGNGNASGAGGNFTLTTGTGGFSGNGGDITLTSGNSGSSSGSGGNLTMTSGFGLSGGGGDFTMSSGEGATTGGNFFISGGGGDSSGGAVEIISGGSFSGPSGSIDIKTSAGGAGNGSLTLQYYGMKIDWFDDGFGNITNDIGFFGATPVAQPTSVPVTAAGIHAALVSLGLIT